MGPMGLTPIVASAVNTVPALVPSAQAGYLIELRADKGVVLTGSKVRLWGDQSSNANDFSQTVSASQPTYVSNWWNGLPGIALQATPGAIGMQTAANVTWGSKQVTIYTVHMLDYTKFGGGYHMYRGGGSNTSSNNAWRVQCATSISGVVLTDNTVSPAGTSVADYTYPYSPVSYPLVTAHTFDLTTSSGTLGMSATFNGTAAAASGVVDPTMGNVNFTTTSQNYLGTQTGTDSIWITFGHYLAFNALHSPTVIAGVTQYLRNLWNVG